MRLQLLYLLSFCGFVSLGQRDSAWNVMVLKKGKEPVVRNTMTTYQPTGFFLYRNCFYDLQLQDKREVTLRLIDIQLDTLVFVGISKKLDANRSLPPSDTLKMNYQAIAKILLKKNNLFGSHKKIKRKNHHFIFQKSLKPYFVKGKRAYVFPGSERKEKLVPRLLHDGVFYFFEYDGELLRYSESQVVTSDYNNEEKKNMLRATQMMLDLMLNKRVYIPLHLNKGKARQEQPAPK